MRTPIIIYYIPFLLYCGSVCVRDFFFCGVRGGGGEWMSCTGPSSRLSLFVWNWGLVWNGFLNIQSNIFNSGIYGKGVGEGDRGHVLPPTFKSGGHKWVCAPPPLLGQSKCSNCTICTYFVVKNTIFFKIFLARSARQLYLSLVNQYLLKFC